MFFTTNIQVNWHHIITNAAGKWPVMQNQQQYHYQLIIVIQESKPIKAFI